MGRAMAPGVIPHPRLVRPCVRRLRRRLREQSGFTVVEGAVAGLLLMFGALGTLQLFDTSTRAGFRAEESQTLNNRLQAELEEIKQLPFAGMALTSLPSHSSDSNDPRWRVNGSNFAISSDGGILKPMVVDAQNGAVDARAGALPGRRHQRRDLQVHRLAATIRAAPRTSVPERRI